MHPLLLYNLLDQRERELDADLEHHRLLLELEAAQAAQPSRVRRSVALGLAALSRGSAAAVRRLDECVADDLGRALAPTE